MKKLLAIVLMTATVLTFSTGMTATAENEEVRPDESGIASQEVELSYNIDPNVYVISMPAEVRIRSSNELFEVKLTETHSEYGINCSVTSRYDSKLKKNENDTDWIDYTFSPASFTLTKSSGKKDINIVISADLKKQVSGNYQDWLTFKFSPATGS